MNRKRKLLYNTFSSLLFQATNIICGFILPRLILANYGSEVNGLVNSITQFLGMIGFLELGVGAVVQSSLYKPLADKDFVTASTIICSANKFFTRLALILLCYITGLLAFFPLLIHSSFDYIYIGTLILAMSISLFAQYYFGVVDRLLLIADQRGYIQYSVSIISLIINTMACVLLIKLDASIQIVKLATSVIFLSKPLIIRLYVNKHYRINRKIKYEGEPIKQKWNGVAQHIAAVVLDGTDTIVLTVLSTLSNVSIYAVYHLVVNGVKTMFTAMTNGIQSLLGELWAKKEIENLRSTFAWTEWTIHTGVTLIFGCTASLIVPFVSIYTLGITDADYNVPIFALLITLANALHCLRLPYNIMILAGGHYKQTQHNYIVAAISNILISVLTVKQWGLIGVAIGTMIAMVYQTIWMAMYDSKNFLDRSISHFVKHVVVDAIIFVCSYAICSTLHLQNYTYLSWVVLAFEVALIWGVISVVINYLFYRNYLSEIMKKVLRAIKVR